MVNPPMLFSVILMCPAYVPIVLIVSEETSVYMYVK